MEYGGGLFAAWMIANDAANPSVKHLPTQITALSNLTDKAASWILKLPISGSPGCPGGSGLLRSIVGIPSFTHRAWELAAFLMHHILCSRDDHPVRTLMFDGVAPPPWHDRILPPRLLRSPIWTRWSAHQNHMHPVQQRKEVRAVLEG